MGVVTPTRRTTKNQTLFGSLAWGDADSADVNAAKNINAVVLAVTMRKATSHVTSAKTKHPDPVKRTTTPKVA